MQTSAIFIVKKNIHFEHDLKIIQSIHYLQGTWVSMGVYSDGSYNVPAGLIYSFPVTCKNGEWSIVQGNLR